MLAVNIDYDAPPTLSAFLDGSDFARVICGPVGSGKSSACMTEFLRRALEQKPGPDGLRRTRFAAVRNTYGQLRDTTRLTFEQWIPHELGTWKERDFKFVLHFNDVRSEVLFRALDRPEDVKKLLSLDLTAAYFNEVREIPKAIWDGMTGRVGRYPPKRDGGATWFGVWADTNPWHAGSWLQKLAEKPPKRYKFFFQPDGLGPAAENVANLPDGYYQGLCDGKDESWIDVYVRGKIASSDVGSIFGAWLDRLAARGGICAFEHGNDDVYTAWDLGRRDATWIWFFQVNRHGVADVIDAYGRTGQHLSHYFEVLKAKPYKYAKHFLPHDAKAKTLATRLSTFEQCQEELGRDKVLLGPSLSIEDGIGAARWHLEQQIRIHTRCGEPIRNQSGGEEHASGLESLREYRFGWDELAKVYSTKPLHTWASNPSDAFRYLSNVIRFTELMTRKPKRRLALSIGQLATWERI